jgi:hypothetical protein
MALAIVAGQQSWDAFAVILSGYGVGILTAAFVFASGQEWW